MEDELRRTVVLLPDETQADSGTFFLFFMKNIRSQRRHTETYLNLQLLSMQV